MTGGFEEEEEEAGEDKDDEEDNGNKIRNEGVETSKEQVVDEDKDEDELEEASVEVGVDDGSLVTSGEPLLKKKILDQFDL